MRRLFILFCGCALLGALGVYFFRAPAPAAPGITADGGRFRPESETDKHTRIWEAIKDHEERTLDQSLGYVPYDRLIEANRMIERRQQELLAGDPSRGDITLPRWRERGPTNIGGRTRAVMIDEGDPARNRVFAGGVSGGLWVTEDISRAEPIWTTVNDWWSNISVGFIAQDPNDPQLIYVGTGEGTASYPIIQGNGIFISTDGGLTFEEAATINGYRFCHHIIVHPETGDAYFATNRGVYRTTDVGQSFERVLSNVSGASGPTFFDLQYMDGVIYASNTRDIYTSTTGDLNDWTDITTNDTGFPAGMSRVEFCVAKTRPQRIYAIGDMGGGASNIYLTDNGGQNWVPRTRPTFDGIEFTRGQVWYDLDIAVSPFDENYIIAGGVPISYSADAAQTMTLYDYSFHVDQHGIFFDEKDPNRILFGNDGGVYVSTNGTPNDVQDKNNIYNVSQYYACALHPEEFSDYMLGGTQDNGSHALDSPRKGPARYVNGGDGVYCHIDQDNPNIQWVSSQFGNYRLSVDGGSNFSGGVSVDGNFINRSDYDSDMDVLYAQTALGDYYRQFVNNGDGQSGPVNVPGVNFNISTIHVDASTPNRLYIGSGLELFRVDDAHDNPTAQSINSFNGTITGIYVQPTNPDLIGVVVGNYGVNNNIWISTDGGDSWVGSEGAAIPNNFPDIPVNDILFNPENDEQAMVATDAGVWTTDKLEGSQTRWYPPVPNTGIPVVRTDMLQVRSSDNIVLAGTYGRGLWTSDVFAEPNARFIVDRVHYTDSPLEFTGSAAYGADSFDWTFGDGTTSTASDPLKSYDEVGEYDVKLTINDDLSANQSVKILPDVSLPYVPGATGYAGSFEGQTEQYGVYTVRGTGWERGNSPVNGKSGTKSGDFAFSTGANENFYAPNSESYLYLPNYDFSDPGIYSFSFFGKWLLDQGLDGLQIQYSTDRGRTWQQLGDRSDSNWYNFRNLDGTGSFPQGASYFSGERGGWQQYELNVSELSGNADVAFRFVFRSDAATNQRGVAVDDIEITKFDGELLTTFTSVDAEYSQATEITVTWTTQPEFQARRFIVERSENGKDYVRLDSLNATGFVTADQQSYSYDFRAQKDLYFVRVRAINFNADGSYYEEVLTETLVVSRREETVAVRRVFPNPFVQQIDLTFNNLVEAPVTMSLYDIAGREVYTERRTLNGESYISLNLPNAVAAGNYVLSVRIGEGEPTSFKLQNVGF